MNSDTDLSDEIVDQIGMLYGRMRNQEELSPFPATYAYCIIAPFDQLLQTMTGLLELKNKFLYIGVSLVLESHAEHGPKAALTLIARIHARSSGVDMEVKDMLFWTSFEEELMPPTFFDGLTVIPSVWKLRVRHALWPPQRYGSPPI